MDSLWGFRGFSSKSPSGHSLYLVFPVIWVVPTPLCHPYGCKGTSQTGSPGCSTARQTYLPRSHLGRPELGIKSDAWHPLLRGIAPLSHITWPTLFSMFPTGAMFLTDCQGMGSSTGARYMAYLLPRGYWGKQARREMGLRCDPSLLC